MNRVLGRLRLFIKIGFSKRFVVDGVLVISFCLFGSFPSLIVRFLALDVFFSCCALSIPFHLSESVYQIRQLRAFMSSVKVPIPVEFSELASKMRVKITSFRVMEGRNACAAFGSLGVGIDLIRDLSPGELLAVVAHELGHIKNRDSFKRALLFIPLLMLTLLSWSRLNSPIFYSQAFTVVMLSAMTLVALLAYINVMMVPFNWNMEFGADEIARRYAGEGNIQSALQKIARAEKMDLEEQSETHPSVRQRLDRLNKRGNLQPSGRLACFHKRAFSWPF